MTKTKPILMSVLPWGGGGGGGGGLATPLQISSDGDDQRIFSGFEIFDPGIFLGRFGKYFFWWFDFTEDFFGYSNNLSNCGSAHVSGNF